MIIFLDVPAINVIDQFSVSDALTNTKTETDVDADEIRIALQFFEQGERQQSKKPEGETK